jgi:FG-GAP repeat/FG-GAP-like repeat
MRARCLSWSAVVIGLLITGCDTAQPGRHEDCVPVAAPGTARPPNAEATGVLALGVPKGQVGPYKGAGYVVLVYDYGKGVDPASRRRIDQASPGIPGEPVNRGGFGEAVAAGDFDHDGHSDLAVSAPGVRRGPILASSVTIVFGAHGGSSGQAVTLATSKECWSFGGVLTVGDFNNDSFDDLAAECGAGTVQIIYGAADLRSRSPERADLGSGTEEPGGIARLAAGDVTGDGYDDLVVESGVDDPADAGYEINVIAGSPRGLTREIGQGRSPRAMNLTDLGVGDVDRDGHADVVANVGPETAVTVYPGTSRGLDTGGAYVGFRPDGSIDSLAMGDVNGDGHADVAYGTSQGVRGIIAGSVTVLYGRAGGISGTGAQVIAEGKDGAPGSAKAKAGLGRRVALGDLDGDGRAELAASAPSQNHGRGAVLVLRGTAAGVGTKGAVMMCGGPHTSLGSVLGGR